jgi:VWFA-related protein
MKSLTAMWSRRVTAAIGMMACLLGLSLFAVDAAKAPLPGTPEYAAWKAALVGAPAGSTKDVTVANAYMSMGCGDYGHWGLKTLAGDPDNPNDNNKNLIFSTYDGWSNGLSVEIDGTLYVLADTDAYAASTVAVGGGGTYATISWTIGDVTLTGTYDLVASDSGRADTGRFTYTFTNPPGKATHVISLKVGLDTKVGGNDEARLATASGITTTELGFGATGSGGNYTYPVPDFWQAFEYDDPAAPGTVGQGTFVGGGATKPDKFVMGNWSEVSSGANFDYSPTGSTYDDSAVGMWWFDRSLPAGTSKSFVVLYGLGRVSSGGTDLRMSVAAPGALSPAGSTFTPNPFSVNVTLLNMTGLTLTNLPVTIALPAGLTVAGGGSSTQYVTSLANGDTTLVSFSVRADPAYGGQTLTYTVTAGAGQSYAVSVSKTVELPRVLVDCDASLWNFAHVMGTGYVDRSRWPEIVTTVRVDTDAGGRCALTAAHFAVTEDGVPQTLTSVTCASTDGSVADIVLIFDDTSSMSGQIGTMKTKATQFANDIVAAGVNARFGLVSFGDKAEVNLDLNLTSSVANFQAAVNALAPAGGGDGPESPLDAIMLAVRDMTWRSGSQRIFVVITDASVHTLSDGSGLSAYNMPETTAAVKAIGGSVFAVGPNLSKGGGLDNDGKPLAAKAYGAVNDIKTLALDTGGFWQDIDVADFSAFVDEIVHVIASLYTVTYSTSNATLDGLWRAVIVTVTDPWATPPVGKAATFGMSDCDDGTYQAPFDTIDCDTGAGDFVHVMAVGYATTSVFPEITATVRVDSAAGRACELTKPDFAAAEDGVWQTITSVTCAGTGGSVADIAIVFDDTSSMSGQIGTMKAKATQFVNDITARGVNARFALVSFKDDETIRQEFTTDVSAYQGAINALSAAGGGDLAETSFDAVMLALTGLTWRDAAQKIVVVITDAPSHYRGDGTAYASSTLAEVKAECSARGASVFAVGPPLTKGMLTDNDGKPVAVAAAKTERLDDIRLLAEGTGGFWQNIATADFGAFVDEIIDVVASLYTVVYTTANSAFDGTLRAVVIRVTDPVEGTDCDNGTYRAPLGPTTCTNGLGNDFVNVMAVGYSAAGIFPQITATVRVDSDAGRACALSKPNFALTEDGTAQTITSVTCAGTAGSVADVVFIFDDTSSMSGQISTMKAKATQFASDIVAAGVDARFGLVSFGDKAEITFDLNLTSTVATFQAAVNGLVASGGGDFPESPLDAIMRAIRDMTWRAGSQRIFVVITDAAVHTASDGSGLSDYNMPETTAAVSAMGGTVFAVGPALTKDNLLGNDGKPVAAKAYGAVNDIKTIALDTGGYWQNLATADFSTFLDGIVHVITSLYTVIYTTSNATLDGSWRDVIVSVTDPVKGTDCDNGEYQAPLECLELVVEPLEISTSCMTGTSPASASFRVRNGCTGTLHYTLSESVPWLSVPSSGTATGADWDNVTVTFASSSLPAGNYVGEITVSGGASTEVVTVHLQVLDLFVERTFPPGCHNAGDLIEVSVTITYGGLGTVRSLAVFEELPAGWSFEGVTSTPEPDIAPGPGASGLCEFSWLGIPALPHVFKYQVRAPSFKTASEGDYGLHCFWGETKYRTTGAEITVPILGQQCIELRDCSIVSCDPHQADQNGDWRIQLTSDAAAGLPGELTRMIQFYNRRGYHCQAGTEDGYAPAVGATSCTPHQTDQNGDWVVQLSPDLTRIIQFYNSGGYHCEAGTEDGYAPGLLAIAKASAVKGTLSTVRSFGSERYTAGSTLDVSVTLSHSTPAALSSLAVQERLPTGWTFNSVVSTPAPSIKPVAGATGTLGFAWVTIPSRWPVTLTYRVNVPAGTTGTKSVTGTASFREDSGETSVTTAASTIVSSEVTVTFAAGVGGSISGTTSQTIFYGGSTTPVTAAASFGYVFTQWDDGSTANPRTLTTVTATQTRTAAFRLANAVAPNGSFLAVISPADVTAGRGLWDLTGTYSTTVAGRPLTLVLVEDSRGRLSGTATLQVSTTKAVVPIVMPIKGSASATHGALVATMAMQGTAAGNAASASLTLKLALNTATRQLVGPASGSALVGAVTLPLAGSVSLSLPAAMDGTWTLLLQVAPNGRTVSGSATLRLANGADYLFVVRGRIAGQTVVATLVGHPSDVAAKGIEISTTLTPLEGGWARLNAFSGKGYGQLLHW